MKALVIDEPWVSLILDGKKTWEMHRALTHIRGRIALIRKASGLVVGLADLVDCIGPLDDISRRAHRDKHCIPAALDESTAHWNTAWVLQNADCLVAPVPYSQPSGAVLWVKLDEDVSRRLQGNFGVTDAPRRTELDAGRRPAVAMPEATRAIAHEPVADIDRGTFVPVVKDGSYFLPSLQRVRKYTVGRKGEEGTFEHFQDALAELRAMPAPYWRRPNSEGNWGIVAGMRWSMPHQESIEMTAAMESM